MSDYDELIDYMRRQGATVTLTGSGHWKIHKDGVTVIAAHSPSDPRALHNIRAELRRHGLLPRRTKFKVTPVELEFLCRFEDGRLRGKDDIPQRLQAKELIKVCNRYKHGRLIGWQAWLTDEGRRVLEMNRVRAD